MNAPVPKTMTEEESMREGRLLSEVSVCVGVSVWVCLCGCVRQFAHLFVFVFL